MKVWHCVPCPAVVKNLIVSELTSYSYQHHDTSMDVTTFKKKKPRLFKPEKQISHTPHGGFYRHRYQQIQQMGLYRQKRKQHPEIRHSISSKF